MIGCSNPKRALPPLPRVISVTSARLTGLSGQHRGRRTGGSRSRMLVTTHWKHRWSPLGNHQSGGDRFRLQEMETHFDLSNRIHRVRPRLTPLVMRSCSLSGIFPEADEHAGCMRVAPALPDHLQTQSPSDLRCGGQLARLPGSPTDCSQRNGPFISPLRFANRRWIVIREHATDRSHVGWRSGPRCEGSAILEC